MRIQGANLPDVIPPPSLPSRGVDESTDSGVQQRDPTDRRDGPLSTRPGDERALPTQAPAGVDHEAWQLLSGEERATLADMKLPTELTYGRTGLTEARGAQARGAHLDVRI